jgi:hypothetical protein
MERVNRPNLARWKIHHSLEPPQNVLEKESFCILLLFSCKRNWSFTMTRLVYAFVFVGLLAASGGFVIHTIVESNYTGLVEFRVSLKEGVIVKLDGRPTSLSDAQERQL